MKEFKVVPCQGRVVANTIEDAQTAHPANINITTACAITEDIPSTEYSSMPFFLPLLLFIIDMKKSITNWISTNAP